MLARLLVVAPLALALAPPASAAGRPIETTWHGKQINLYDAQPAGRYGKGVVVAVLDSWVDISHPDFEGRARAGADCTGESCVPGQKRDACTHGTHVAGTVASSSFGVAPQATLLPVQVLTAQANGDCTGKASSVAAGIRWATQQGADVINLSLGPAVPGLSSSSEIPGAVKAAAQAGVVVVFSAGNQDLPLAQSYGEDALVVAATGPSGELASYSQRGAGVSVAAPGGQPQGDSCSQQTCITSLFPDGQYAVAAGTSMAAPHVAGLAALLLGQQPNRSSQSVRDRIKATARPLAGAGAGLVDARAALGVASPKPRPRATTAPARPRPTPAPKPAVRPTPARPSTPPAAPVGPTPTAPAVAEGSPSPLDPVGPTPIAAGPPPAPEDVPAPLAVLAAALVVAAAAAVGSQLWSRRAS